jgi:hypothetical protein
LIFAAGCSSETDGSSVPATGGTPSTVTGGATGSGGSTGSSGASSGGNRATGGSSASGGFSTSGGRVATGGFTASGGSGGSGGGVASGGSTTSGNQSGGGAGASGGGSGGAVSATGGTAGASGGSAASSGKGGASGAPSGGSGGGATATEKFSFFVTSLEGLVRLSGKDDGFGGDLRYGEATGLEGADKICRELAEASMPGAGQKQWRAFLSTTTVDAVDRIGDGPWYDRLGRLLAMNKQNLLQERPAGGDVAIVDDLPNEDGTPNHSAGKPGCAGNDCPDNHDTLTGSSADGTWDGKSTCDDWTSTTASGQPRIGHSWPAFSGRNWIQAHTAGGCQAGVNLVQTGGTNGVPTVGAGGGYGGFYCFALTP